MPRIPEEEIERIKRETDLVALVRGRGVELKKQGKDLVGHCPFHDDKTPSFVVSPSKNLWNCLGACNTGGSVIDFLMRIDNITFPRAVELLRAGSAKIFSAEGTKRSRTALENPLQLYANDLQLLKQVSEFYHETLKRTPAALEYLEQRGIRDSRALERFRIGLADRSLFMRLPPRNNKQGREYRERLRELGLTSERGNEVMWGCLTFPLFDLNGAFVSMYGRFADDSHGRKSAKHRYLSGPMRGFFNPDAVKLGGEIILCESVIDALTFWVNGFQNVTTSFGVNGFTDEMLRAFIDHRITRVLIAYDRDQAGDKAASELAKRLMDEGIEALRVNFPRGMDANDFARKTKPSSEALKLLLDAAEPAGPLLAPQAQKAKGEPKTAVAQTNGGDVEPPPLVANRAEPLREVTIESPLSAVNVPLKKRDTGDVEIKLGDRHYRIRGLEKNSGYDSLKINLRVARNESYHLDNLDLYNAKARGNFIGAAVEELETEQDTLKRDLARILLKLEELQEERIRSENDPSPLYEMTPEEAKEALEYLKKPALLERIADDFEACGLVGERTNSIVAYLAALSRKTDKPLAVIIQSSSSAGKSTLMDAVLKFMPPEDVIQYSAMTGQSLFYLGEKDLKHKILAIGEEEGARNATYALKLLQSDGRLTMASTSKDESGKMSTREYYVEGPVMVFTTSTSIEIDEELRNRCIIITVNESPEQTKRIHELQRKRRMEASDKGRETREHLTGLHRNIQRLLKPLPVFNSYAADLRFPFDVHRARRDHEKYLMLMDALTLLKQFQRSERPRSHG